MRVIIQRVTQGKVTIQGTVRGQISKGYVILLGVKVGDTEREAKILADKIVKLRVMEDEDGKMNLSILDTKGEILVISQFTLYGDASGGRRPSFIQAARPEVSKPLYELFISELRSLGIQKVETGEFGAYMDVEIHNDGPTTIIMEC